MKKVKHHEADINNKNAGTSGISITRKKSVDNTANQKNPMHPEYKGKKGS